MTNKIHIFGTLYSLSSKGKVKQWDVWVEEREGQYYVGSSHGYQGMKMATEYSSAVQGKNIGKKNETLPLDQAVLEARSKWRAKIDKNYSETVPGSTEDFVKVLPMLAHKYQDRKHKIIYPCYVQPKLNGVRCLAQQRMEEEDFLFTSRGGKEYTTLRHIEEALVTIWDHLPGVPPDGEIFNPDMSFEDIIRGVKKQRDITLNLEYWVYDLADPTKTFRERLRVMQKLKDALPEDSPIKFVETHVVYNEEELMELHRQFSEEYEGTMIRNAEGMYVYDFRSSDLLKLKDFVDEEFEVIGGKEGSGSDEGTVVFRCKTKDGGEFDVRPRGDRDKRKYWMENLEDIVGKMLTVRFQNYSEAGIPIFPVGLIIRDYE
jgi:DNA ligase-1